MKTTYQQDIQYQAYRPRLELADRQRQLDGWQRAVTIVNRNFS
ncbi:hypothetical protein [Lactiplantibacillus plantarum]|nr:hypothetical protein [Lactiplantibacillus plantarum]